MGTRFPRVIALFFVLALLATPHSILLAQDQDKLTAATPVVTEPGNDGAPTDGTEVQADGSDSDVHGDVATSTDEGTNLSRMNRPSSVGINAVIQDDYSISNLAWDDVNAQLTMDLNFTAAFSAAAGDTVVVTYSSDSLSLSGEQASPTGLPVTVSVNGASESVTLTFTEDFTAALGSTYSFVLNGEVRFPACLPADNPTFNEAEIEIWFAGSSESIIVLSDDVCEPVALPAISDVRFVPETDAILIELDVPQPETAAGFVATIRYEKDKINIPNGTISEFFLESWNPIDPVPFATAVANDGVITITFHDVGYEGNEPVYIASWLVATLEPTACVDTSDKDIVDIGQLYFVANPGGTFNSYIDVALCNAAPATKTGVLSDDGTEIYWTIDSGDLLHGGILQEGGLLTGLQFDCESIEVELIAPDAEARYEEPVCWEMEGQDYADWFDIRFSGEGPVRIIVTVTSIVDTQSLIGSVVNCSIVAKIDDYGLTAVSARNTNAGWGTTVCAEVHTRGVGDTISNVVSSQAVHQGDILTYTVTYTSTTGLWLSLSLDDVLPQGFQATSTSCTFSPDELREGSCELADDNTLEVGLFRFNDMGNDPAMSSGGQITLVIEGTVTAAPGTELISQACGIREFNVPGFPPILTQIGGGAICASTSTHVLQVPTETPSPSPTPDPTSEPTETPSPTPDPGETPSPAIPVDPTGTPDPIASPTVPAESDPTATSAVTGLPSTGSSGPSAAPALFVAVIAAGILIAAGIGIQLRPRE